jgi:CDGSH-type Zn-finger protein
VPESPERKANVTDEKHTSTTIIPAPDGPYIVKALDELSNRKGRVEAKPQMALCRCGASKNKPFCDGTHGQIGFTSQKRDDRVPDKRESYEGDDVTVHDNRGICAHAGYCTDGLPSVFRLKQEPWIDPNGASGQEIVDTVKKCPSGALSVAIRGTEERETGGAASIFIAPNGPYVVKGSPELSDTSFGEGASKSRFTLCRCGGSKNKPFCDGTHWSNGFEDDDN